MNNENENGIVEYYGGTDFKITPDATDRYDRVAIHIVPLKVTEVHLDKEQADELIKQLEEKLASFDDPDDSITVANFECYTYRGQVERLLADLKAYFSR